MDAEDNVMMVDLEEPTDANEEVENVPVVEEPDGEKELEEEVVELEAEVDAEMEKDLDPYAYTKRNEFTSESFKIEVQGLPKSYGHQHFRKFLIESLQLEVHKIKTGFMLTTAFISFKNEKSKEKALQVLDGYKWNNCELSAKPADPAKDPMILAKIDYLKFPNRKDGFLPLDERVAKATIPLHEIPYEKQLQEKEKNGMQVMRKFGNNLGKLNPELAKFVHFHKIRRKGQICEMDSITPSPVQEAYRNKCEFSIGMNADKTRPVVGFRVASYKDGSVEVGPVGHLRHINDRMKQVAKAAEDFLAESGQKVYDPIDHDGVWRQITMRTSNNGDLLLVFIIHPQQLSDEEKSDLQKETLEYFTKTVAEQLGVTAIFWQEYSQKSGGKMSPMMHLWGKQYIEETILDKKFRASPNAFLQTNTAGCEELYKKVLELCDIDTTTIVLDICCGVGTIGISLANEAFAVYGADICEESVESGRKNAEANECTNVFFMEGKAEDNIKHLLSVSKKNTTIAIVDPPRGGLHGSVMNALRRSDQLDKIIYISCDSQAALANFEALCKPKSKQYKGEFFVPIKGLMVDLFPDTPHYELVVLFERYDECKWRRIMEGNPRPKDEEYFKRIPEQPYDTEKYKRELEDRQDDLAKEGKRGKKDRWWERARNNYLKEGDKDAKAEQWEAGNPKENKWEPVEKEENNYDNYGGYDYGGGYGYDDYYANYRGSRQRNRNQRNNYGQNWVGDVWDNSAGNWGGQGRAGESYWKRGSPNKMNVGIPSYWKNNQGNNYSDGSYNSGGGYNSGAGYNSGGTSDIYNQGWSGVGAGYNQSGQGSGYDQGTNNYMVQYPGMQNPPPPPSQYQAGGNNWWWNNQSGNNSSADKNY